MTTQQVTTLRERVARVLVDFRPSRTATLDEGIRETADVVLAAIGLDDWEAAVERMCVAYLNSRNEFDGMRDFHEALAAALNVDCPTK